MTPSRRLAALFCLAVLGVLAVVGIVVGALAGAVGLLGYAAVVGLLLAVAVTRGRRLLQPPAPPGRTCACCTTSRHDPVKVL